MSNEKTGRAPSERPWFTSSYSSGEGGMCVEVATAPGTVRVRDSKNRTGPQLSFRDGEWTAFTTACGPGGSAPERGRTALSHPPKAVPSHHGKAFGVTGRENRADSGRSRCRRQPSFRSPVSGSAGRPPRRTRPVVCRERACRCGVRARWRRHGTVRRASPSVGRCCPGHRRRAPRSRRSACLPGPAAGRRKPHAACRLRIRIRMPHVTCRRGDESAGSHRSASRP
ncbi:DUF397 domain-containing protein [Streptomyces sp. F63]|uniref:DUF397 domain-containing protein n=1 Tax=Streptomyces sp. F63 TaxID=2824887 RepID=UPI001B362B7E|nr:DUF397 domain-containing protein [Streptomyces sp. F63]